MYREAELLTASEKSGDGAADTEVGSAKTGLKNNESHSVLWCLSSIFPGFQIHLSPLGAEDGTIKLQGFRNLLCVTQIQRTDAR